MADFDGARNHVADLVRHAQFVIPFHLFAHHAGLVEHFLRPMDRPRARAELAFFGNRRASGAEDERHAVARQVGEVVDGVGGADIDVHHHRLRAAGHQIGAVRHGHRQILVRHQHRFRNFGVGFLGAVERLHDRREIGAGIGRRNNRCRDRRARAGRLRRRSAALAPSRCDGHVVSSLMRAPACGRGYWFLLAVFYATGQGLTTESARCQRYSAAMRKLRLRPRSRPGIWRGFRPPDRPGRRCARWRRASAARSQRDLARQRRADHARLDAAVVGKPARIGVAIALDQPRAFGDFERELGRAVRRLARSGRARTSICACSCS